MSGLLQKLIEKIEAWREPCKFCRARKKLSRIMAIIETIPETGQPIHDEPMSDLFNAADNAKSAWGCYCDWGKR